MKTLDALKMLLVCTFCAISVMVCGMSCEAATQSEAMQWVKSQVGKSIDVDGYAGAQCVDLIKAYYSYLGVSPVSGNGCDYSWNALPNGWTRLQGATPQPGDILVYSGNNSNPYGHVAIYESTYSTYHQNFSGAYVEQVTYIAYNGFSNAYWGVIRPAFSVADTTPPTISDIKITDVSANGYTVTCTVTDNTGVTSVKFPSWNTDIHQGEDANWLEGTISGNTASVRVNTKDLKSGAIEGNFNTDIYAYDAAGNQSSGRAGTIYIDRTAPVIESAEVIQVDDKGYVVEIKATDNKKIDRIQCPTWTIKDGQDDLANEWPTNASVKATSKGNNIYEFRVNISAHNNEYGKYRTHIYAYDSCGNSVLYKSLSDVIVDSVTTDSDGWSYCHVIPDNVNSDDYLIEYNNYYEKIQKDSPGSDWTNAGVVKNEWQNSGNQYTSESDLETSDSRILVRSVYYHFCGPNAGNAGNYEQSGNFVHYDEIGAASVIPTYCGVDNGHPYYVLDWIDGGGRVYCQSGVTCDGSYGTHGERCKAWYKMNTYQDRVKVEQYKYTKTSGWTNVEDSSATSVEIRYKKKEIEITGIKLSQDELIVTEGKKVTLEVSVLPEDADNVVSLVWSSDNEEVVSVIEGEITAKKAGTAIITVMTQDGAFEDSCQITVNATTEEPTTEKSTTEEPTTEKPTAEQTTTQEATTEKATTEQATTQEATTEKATTEQTTTQEATTEKATTEQTTTQEATTEKTTTEQMTTQEAMIEKPTTQETTTEKPKAEKPTTEELTAEQPTMEEQETEDTTIEDLEESNETALPVKGTLEIVSSAIYEVSKSTTSQKEVVYVNPVKQTKTSVTIPATVVIDGYIYKVTGIDSKAFKNNKKLKSVTIGKNVKKIGKEAFYNCKNLKKITIKSSVLKSVGKNAIKNINKKATIKVPKKKLQAYKKLFKSKTGYKKTMKIKK